MADTKISDLAAVTDVLATDEYVLARSGATKKIDASNLLVASEVAFTPAGTIAATDVQAAIVEVATEAAAGGLYDAYAYIRDEKTANTAAGSFTSGAWRTRELNTSTDPASIVSLSSNQFTLQAGAYFIVARAPCLSVSAHKTRIRNITDSTTPISGSSDNSGSAAGGTSFAIGRIVIASAKVFEFQHQCQTTKTTDGLGFPSNFGEVEVYAQVQIYREA